MRNSKQYRWFYKYITCLFGKLYLFGSHRSPMFTSLPASLRLASLFTFYNHAHGGLWENYLKIKVTHIARETMTGLNL